MANVSSTWNADLSIPKSVQNSEMMETVKSRDAEGDVAFYTQTCVEIPSETRHVRTKTVSSFTSKGQKQWNGIPNTINPTIRTGEQTEEIPKRDQIRPQKTGKQAAVRRPERKCQVPSKSRTQGRNRTKM